MGGKLSKYLEAGEGVNLEFKRCGGKVEKDVFETLCSFANRQGGSILLGVLDDGSAPGVSPESVVSLERSIVNVVNDPNLFNVAPAIEFERLGEEGGNVVLRVWVPMGPAPCSWAGSVGFRSGFPNCSEQAASDNLPG